MGSCVCKRTAMACTANDGDDYHTFAAQYCNAFQEKLYYGDYFPRKCSFLTASGQIQASDGVE